ncbi:MAG: 3-isopropylmalate dehydratase small subunit [bacterium]
MTRGKIKGLAWVFGDNIDTDQIIPSQYCNTFDPEVLASHAMEGANADFTKSIAPGDIIVAGRNFGCGSSREAAPLALKTAGVGAIVAHSFARLFFRNAINIGLYILVSPPASEDISQGDELEIDIVNGFIRSMMNGRTYRAHTFPHYLKEIIDQGGMVNYVKHRLAED